MVRLIAHMHICHVICSIFHFLDYLKNYYLKLLEITDSVIFQTNSVDVYLKKDVLDQRTFDENYASQ